MALSKPDVIMGSWLKLELSVNFWWSSSHHVVTGLAADCSKHSDTPYVQKTCTSSWNRSHFKPHTTLISTQIGWQLVKVRYCLSVSCAQVMPAGKTRNMCPLFSVYNLSWIFKPLNVFAYVTSILTELWRTLFCEEKSKWGFTCSCMRLCRPGNCSRRFEGR
jgi:hypothetical protein